jgi:hypothetical protein
VAPKSVDWSSIRWIQICVASDGESSSTPIRPFCENGALIAAVCHVQSD